MAEVKFVNTVKYKGAFHPAHTPFIVDDKDVEGLVQQGAIVTIPPQAIEKSAESGKPLDAMKVDELIAYAEEHDISIGDAHKKADILAAIKAAEDSAE